MAGGWVETRSNSRSGRLSKFGGCWTSRGRVKAGRVCRLRDKKRKARGVRTGQASGRGSPGGTGRAPEAYDGPRAYGDGWPRAADGPGRTGTVAGGAVRDVPGRCVSPSLTRPTVTGTGAPRAVVHGMHVGTRMGGSGTGTGPRGYGKLVPELS
ncbi:unnamed protein product [Boreogadus saida]